MPLLTAELCTLLITVLTNKRIVSIRQTCTAFQWNYEYSSINTEHTCATSIHFSMMRARCDVVNAADADAADDDSEDNDDDGVLSTTDAMTRCVTALNWSTVADTVATVSSELQPRDWPARPFCRLELLARRDHTDPRHCCGSTFRNRSCNTQQKHQKVT